MELSFHSKIRQLRTQLGLNQVEFADRIGVTKQCISNWENDNVLPSIEMLARLADFFGVSTDELLGRESKQPLRADGLTSEQIAHIRFLIKDFAAANQKSRELQEVIQNQKLFNPHDRG